MGAQILKEMGFTNVTYMEGGMEAWREAGLPTKE
ncbi:MAG: rhodanese-like domain-containing protein [Chloroflexi bacterium]|nr:rhodanese-like domain-containing protein [Chloroflexota bacterium]MCH8989580.1 rhodanese-like domain-containing protein [Chloroflexota bacterium]